MNELTVMSRGGDRFSVSPLGSQEPDVEALVRFHQDLSAGSAQRRFFSGATQHLAPARLGEIVGPKPGDVLLVARDVDGRIAGVAHAIVHPDRPVDADVAVTVADRWQRQGLGTSLLDQLVRTSAGVGIRRLRGHVQSDNRTARSLIAGVASRVGDETGIEWWADEPGVLGFAFAVGAVHRRHAAA